jgi:hypothetical protein
MKHNRWVSDKKIVSTADKKERDGIKHDKLIIHKSIVEISGVSLFMGSITTIFVFSDNFLKLLETGFVSVKKNFKFSLL